MKNFFLVMAIVFSGVRLYGQAVAPESAERPTETTAVAPVCKHQGSGCAKECCKAKAGKKNVRGHKKACCKAENAQSKSSLHGCSHHAAVQAGTHKQGEHSGKPCCAACTHSCCAKK